MKYAINIREASNGFIIRMYGNNGIDVGSYVAGDMTVLREVLEEIYAELGWLEPLIED